MSLILIVDDHRDTCRMLARMVRSMGWETKAVESGQAALDFVLASPDRPALVLLDVTMPNMNGFETLRRLRALTNVADLPVVVMSALSDDAYREIAETLGAAAFWVKGNFEPGQLGGLLTQCARPVRD